MKIMTADLPPPAFNSYGVVAETARANVFLMANLAAYRRQLLK
jgi:hypothetical protein